MQRSSRLLAALTVGTITALIAPAGAWASSGADVLDAYRRRSRYYGGSGLFGACCCLLVVAAVVVAVLVLRRRRRRQPPQGPGYLP